MRKTIIFILLALIMLGAIGYFYVNRILLPKFHVIIENKIAEQVRRPVNIGRIQLELTKGFHLYNVLIKEPDSDRSFVQIDEIDCTLLLAPFFKDRTIVIPNITIRRPITRIVQYPDGSFNFSDILNRQKKVPEDDRTDVFVTHIKIIRGAVDYLKKTAAGDFSENFRDIAVDLSLSLDRQVDFRLKTILPFEQTAVETRGRYTLGTKNFYAEIIASQLNVVKYQRQFLPLPDYQIHSGNLATCDLRLDYFENKLKISGDAYFAGIDMNLKRARKFSGDVRLLNTTLLVDGKNLTGKGEIRIPAVRYELEPDRIFEGDLQLFIESLSRKKQDWFLTGNIKARNIDFTLPDNKSIQTHLISRGTTLAVKNDQISVFGEFDFEDATVNIKPDRVFTGQVFAKNLSLKQTDGQWSASGAVRSEQSSLTFGSSELVNSIISVDKLVFKSTPRAVTLNGNLQFTDAVFAFGKNVKFQGSPSMDINYARPRTEAQPSTFTGDLTFQNGLLLGIPRIATLSNLEGDLRISKDGATSEKIGFNIENTNVTVSGALNDWKTQELDVTASTPSVELSRVTPLVPEIFKRFGIDLDGRASLRMIFRGFAPAWKEGDIQLTVGLINTRLSGPKIPGVFEGLNGELRYTRDKLEWSGLKATYKQFPFEITGHMENFSKPVINTSLTAKNLKTRANIHLLNKTIRIPEVTAKYHNSDFEGSADIYFIADQEPEIQVNGRGTLYASDVPLFFPQHAERLAPLSLEGVCDTKFFFKGKPSQRLDWSISVDAKTPRLSVKNHPLQDVKINYLQRDKNISKFDLAADIYGGKLKLDSSANLENKQFPFKFALGIYNAELSQFIVNHQPEKKSALAGAFSMNLGLAGELKKQTSWQGQGDYKIEDGYIWDFRIIKLLNKIMIREFIRTVYTDSSATFTIADRRVNTENLVLKSATISLQAKGSVDFDQNIKFDVYPYLSEIAQIQSEDEIFKKLTTVVVSKTLNIIKLSGTLKEPKSKIVATDIPTNLIKGTTHIIKGVGETLLDTFLGQ